MRASTTLKATMLCAVLMTTVLSALPAFAAGDTTSCSPATCTAPVVGPGHHLDEETR
jgi:hypothetical protein